MSYNHSHYFPQKKLGERKKKKKPRMNRNSCLILQKLKQKLYLKKFTWHVILLVLGYIMFEFLSLCIFCALEIMHFHVNGRKQDYIAVFMKGSY